MFNNTIKSILACAIFLSLSAALHAGGAVKVEKKPDLLGGIGGPIISKDGKPVKVMVMPVSVTIPKEVKKHASLDDEKSKELREKAWKKLSELVDDSEKLIKATAPDGAEADEVVKKTIEHAAGMLPAAEFKKIKKFKLPEKFIYGHVSITLVEEEELKGLKVIKHVKYSVDAQIRLVETENFTYQPVLATDSDADLETAIKKAMKKALDKYRLSDKEKPKKEEGGGGYFG